MEAILPARNLSQHAVSTLQDPVPGMSLTLENVCALRKTQGQTLGTSHLDSSCSRRGMPAEQLKWLPRQWIFTIAAVCVNAHCYTSRGFANTSMPPMHLICVSEAWTRLASLQVSISPSPPFQHGCLALQTQSPPAHERTLCHCAVGDKVCRLQLSAELHEGFAHRHAGD